MKSSPPIRWGILGCGKIARKFASDLSHVTNATLQAVAAREHSTAQAFAHEFPAPCVFGSYEAMAVSHEVDVIYIATPHGLHHEHIRLCLEHGKAVLCEKTFTINARQTRDMISLAQTRHVFLMEAFWTRFLPHYQKVRELVQQGTVGDIRYIHAEFGFRPSSPVSQRLYDPDLGGGALLDIGVYPVFLALDLLGKPDIIHARMTAAPTGVDEQCTIQLGYRNGAMANLFATFSTHLATGADLAGTNGRIRLPSRFHGPTAQIEFYATGVDSRQQIPTGQVKGFGYEYEAQHVTDCLLQGLTESPFRTHADTLLLMETLDRIRAEVGIHYPVD
jgi:predicted dehydrogenase